MHNGKISRSLRVALLLLLAALAAAPVLAQQITGLPQASQRQTIVQTIGVTDVTIVYHRPRVNGREVWGRLVPYGQVWRSGANDNTTISFTHPVKVEGQELAAGTYGLHTLPGEDSWQVIFSTNSTSWGSFSYDEQEDALRVTVKPEKAPFQEELEYSFEHLTADGAVVTLHWAELAVPFELEVDTNAHALAHIRNQLRSLPGFFWQGWNSAASYCLQNNVAEEQCLEWIDRALAMEENFSNLRVKSGLLEQLGRNEEAAELAERSLQYANEAQVNALGYQHLQRGAFDKAIEVFAKNVADYPESWNVYDSLAEGQAAKGMTQEAIANYTKALSMAPEDQHERIKNILAGLKSTN